MRQLKWYGGAAGAVVAIGGFVALAAPITRDVLDSGPLPIPSRNEVAQLAQQLQTLQHNNTQQQQQLQEVSKSLDFNTMGNLTNELFLRQHELGPRPSAFELKAIQDLKDQINTIRRRLRLPPIQ